MSVFPIRFFCVFPYGGKATILMDFLGMMGSVGGWVFAMGVTREWEG